MECILVLCEVKTHALSYHCNHNAAPIRHYRSQGSSTHTDVETKQVVKHFLRLALEEASVAGSVSGGTAATDAVAPDAVVAHDVAFAKPIEGPLSSPFLNPHVGRPAAAAAATATAAATTGGLSKNYQSLASRKRKARPSTAPTANFRAIPRGRVQNLTK
jgi:hypothetical protein